MKNKIATTIEQSKKLLELGIGIDTADMEYILEQWIDEKTHRHKEGYCEIPVVKVDDDCPLQPITLPCWSLSAMLSLLPLSISKEKGYPYFLEWQFWNDNSFRYIDPPYSNERKCLVDIYSDHDEKRKDYIDTVFEMIVYLKENKLI